MEVSHGGYEADAAARGAVRAGPRAHGVGVGDDLQRSRVLGRGRGGGLRWGLLWARLRGRGLAIILLLRRGRARLGCGFRRGVDGRGLLGRLGRGGLSDGGFIDGGLRRGLERSLRHRWREG